MDDDGVDLVVAQASYAAVHEDEEVATDGFRWTHMG